MLGWCRDQPTIRRRRRGRVAVALSCLALASWETPVAGGTCSGALGPVRPCEAGAGAGAGVGAVDVRGQRCAFSFWISLFCLEPSAFHHFMIMYASPLPLPQPPTDPKPCQPQSRVWATHLRRPVHRHPPFTCSSSSSYPTVPTA